MVMSLLSMVHRTSYLESMWACRLIQLMDFEYEKLRWRPRDCDMEEFQVRKDRPDVLDVGCEYGLVRACGAKLNNLMDRLIDFRVPKQLLTLLMRTFF
ncbi:hypothetical protein A4A49_51801 [Nicotiana attenuata]|uniref:Uncharacterized protein n=1 Tax=Nicotiana attenuata TaxID=49451 RepID=A0A314LCB6_NICAT|nr:hypothetical protein A4A49_51801 [Nicotiana attenuata]